MVQLVMNQILYFLMNKTQPSLHYIWTINESIRIQLQIIKESSYCSRAKTQAWLLSMDMYYEKYLELLHFIINNNVVVSIMQVYCMKYCIKFHTFKLVLQISITISLIQLKLNLKRNLQNKNVPLHPNPPGYKWDHVSHEQFESALLSKYCKWNTK